MKIFKYLLTLEDSQVLYLPKGAKILSVGEQRGILYLWAEVDPEADPEPRTIEIIGTGNPMLQEKRVFIGTVLPDPFVWHVYEIVSPKLDKP